MWIKIFIVLVITSAVFGANQWKSLGSSGSAPPKLGDSSAILSSDKKTMIIFGGVSETGQASGSLFSFSTTSFAWSKIPVFGTIPSPRYGHSSVVTPSNSLIIFGGVSGSATFNDLWMYTPDGSTWTASDATGAPEPRTYHAAAAAPDGRTMYVFGGRSATGSLLNDLYSYNYESNTWASLPNGDAPSARYGATAVTTANQAIILFGGNDGKPKNDIYYYDVASNVWTTLTPNGDSPSPRYRHTAVITSKNNMIVYGGETESGEYPDTIEVYSLSRNSWMQPTIEGSVPKGKNGMSVAVGNSQLFYFGGSQDSTFYNDVQRFTYDEKSFAPKPKDNSLSTGAIVGIAIGLSAFCVAASIILALLVAREMKRRKKAEEKRKDKARKLEANKGKKGSSGSKKGGSGSKNDTPTSGSPRPKSERIKSPGPSKSAEKSSSSRPKSERIRSTHEDKGKSNKNEVTIDLIPMDDLKSSPKPKHKVAFNQSDNLYLSDIEVGKRIGDNFYVFNGIWNKKTEVVLKTQADEEKISKFENEIDTLFKLDHPNIVTPLGLFRKSSDTYLVLEKLSKGSLREFLRNPQVQKDISDADLLMFCVHIAAGCRYMEKSKLIHRNLASRHILIGQNGEKYIAKISNFGLSAFVRDGETAPKITYSVRWSAPEALEQKPFTFKSDVWSYGVCLWEIFEFGKVPYQSMSSSEIILQVIQKNYRLPKPDRCPTEVWEIIQACWIADPEKRPSIEEVYTRISEVYGKYTATPPPSFERLSELLRVDSSEIPAFRLNSSMSKF